MMRLPAETLSIGVGRVDWWGYITSLFLSEVGGSCLAAYRRPDGVAAWVASLLAALAAMLVSFLIG